MKHKHFLIIALFVFFSCTLTAAQTRKIEAKNKTQESSATSSSMNKPEIVFNVGHFHVTYSTCFSPDGKYIASGSYDGSIKLWKVATGRCVKTITAGVAVTSVAYSPDGKYVASGMNDAKIKIWEVRSGECIKTLSGADGEVSSLFYF